MIREAISIGLILVLIGGVFGAISCGGNGEGEVTVKEFGIKGIHIPCPEAEGKLEVKHEIVRGYSPGVPAIAKLILKNISNKPFKLESSTWVTYDYFSLRVISKDKLGQILEESEEIMMILQPKEVKTREISLFCSDEATRYEIKLEYKGSPHLTGRYVEVSGTKGIVEVNHRYSPSRAPKIEVEVKNISKKLIALCGPVQDWQKDYYGPFKIRVIYKDVSGHIMGQDEKWWLMTWGHLYPGETSSYTFRVDSNAQTYEIILIKMVKKGFYWVEGN